VAARPWRLASLCTGYGGLELGLRLAGVEVEPVLYVEREAFSAAHLVGAMEAGAMAPAPVWSDLCSLDATAWRGCVDILTAGFPCQPFSVAGSRLGLDDERWLWPHIARIIRDMEPGVVFLENVPGLAIRGLGHVLGDLAALGFDAEWGVFRASEAGAPHRRARIFVAAYTDGLREPQPGRSIAHERRRPRDGHQAGGDVGHATRIRRGEGGATAEIRCGWSSSGGSSAFPPGPGDPEGWRRYVAAGGPQPCIRRGADGTASRVDRLRMLGNGVVPQQAALAWRELTGRVTA